MYDNSSVLVNINKELDVGLDHLINKCEKYREKILKNREIITSSIKSQVLDGNLNVCKTLRDVHDDRVAIISLKNKIEQLKLKFVKFKTETEHFRNVFQKLINDLNHKCNHMMYFACLRCVVNISNKIKTDFARKRSSEVIISYKNLCELSSAMNSSKCKHLLSYINQVIIFWHSVLEQYYSEDFEIILKQIKWPFTMKNSIDVSKLDHFKQNFQRLADKLLKIQLPITNHTDSSETSSVLQLTDHFSHISSPINILVKPLRKRFFFHFSGKKQTNKPDKPEWFLSRVISWIRDYKIFIVDWLGPVYKDNCKRPIDSLHEFIIGLLQSVVIKLNSDLQYFQLEDVTFSHIVDETLAFEHELRNVYAYPNDYPSITEVLTQADIFFKWINLERKYANIKMDAILQNNNKWDILVKDNKYFMTVCAENVLISLDALRDRYSVLRQPRHKLQFLKLQNDLLEEFKQKIIDSFDENTSDEYLPVIICTLHYISYTLYNWGTNVHFLSLLNYKCDLENEVRIKNENSYELEIVETVFDDTINSYQFDIDRLLNTLCDNIMSTIIKHSKPYKRDRWHIMNSLTDENKYSITDNSWIFYETFSKNLSTLSQNLPNSVFNKCWPKLATKLSTFIYNDILLDNMFNKGGAQHLLGDVRYKLLPIFSKYTTKPIIYTERLLEACRVLCFEPNFKPVALTQNEISEILLRRIEHGNSID